MNYETIVLTRNTVTGVAELRLCRPDKLNAMDDTMFSELQHVIQEVARDDSIRVLVLTGEGRGFSAGADLKSSILSSEGAASLKLFWGFHGNVVRALRRLRKPVIGALNGVAVGSGLGVALACDIRIASENFKIATGFKNLGAVSDWGNAYFLPRIIGTANALHLYFSGDLIGADEALRLGLVNQVVPEGELQQAAMDYATKVAEGATLAMALAKELVYMGVQMSLEDFLDVEAVYQSLAFSTADYKEGLVALKEKRLPHFSRP